MSARLPNASRFVQDFCPNCCQPVDTTEADDMFRRDGEGIVNAECAETDCGALLTIETYAVRDVYEEGGVTLEHRVKQRAARGAA